MKGGVEAEVRPQRAGPRELAQEGEPEDDVANLELGVLALRRPPLEFETRLHGASEEVEQTDARSESDPRVRLGGKDRAAEHVDSTQTEGDRLGREVAGSQHQADREATSDPGDHVNAS